MAGKEENGKFLCPNCNADITKNGSIAFSYIVEETGRIIVTDEQVRVLKVKQQLGKQRQGHLVQNASCSECHSSIDDLIRNRGILPIQSEEELSEDEDEEPSFAYLDRSS